MYYVRNWSLRRIILQVSPTECFLRYLQLPENETVAVDLKQAAVVIMSHLDRLAAPYAPPATFTKVGTEIKVDK